MSIAGAKRGGLVADIGVIPLPLVLLTLTSGMVDAVSYLKFGHVFVANMTGNVIFLGFVAAGYREISAVGSVIALAAFLAGALAGGGLVLRAKNQAHLLLAATSVKFCLSVIALLVAALSAVAADTAAAYVVIAILAVAMGIQNAAARKIAAPDFTTTVLTMTITGIAADLTAGASPKLVRRLLSVAAMFLGALTMIAICCFFAATLVATYANQRQGKTAIA
jgi:uncharacterized membrane protein YoaK (UPF0700 family)